MVWTDTVPFIFEWQSSTGSWQIVHGHHGRLLNLAQTRSPTSYFTGVGFFLARIFGEKPEHKKSLKLQMLLKRFASPLCYIWPPETFTLKSKSWFYLVAPTPSKNRIVLPILLKEQNNKLGFERFFCYFLVRNMTSGKWLHSNFTHLSR